FLGAFDRGLLHGADSAHVVLVVEDARLERRPLLREERAARGDVRDAHGGGERHDLKVILRMSLVVLLAGALADAWMSWDVDAGLRAVRTGEPRALATGDVTIRVQFRRRLTEVPHVSLFVLRVPIRGAFFEVPSLEESVVHLGRADTGNQPRPNDHGDDVARRLSVLHAAVRVARPRF